MSSNLGRPAFALSAFLALIAILTAALLMTGCATNALALIKAHDRTGIEFASYGEVEKSYAENADAYVELKLKDDKARSSLEEKFSSQMEPVTDIEALPNPDHKIRRDLDELVLDSGYMGSFEHEGDGSSPGEVCVVFAHDRYDAPYLFYFES